MASEQSPALPPRWLPRPGQLRRALGRVALHAVLIGLAILFLLPFLFAISTSLKDAGQIFQVPPEWIPNPVEFGNYPEALTALPFLRYLGNTVFLAVARVVGLTLSCSLAAYALARLRWKGRNVVFLLVLATLMVPEEIMLVPQYLLFSKLGWVDSFLPLIVPAYFANNAFFVFLLRQFFMTIPREVDEAARIDGANNFQIYWRIIMPLSKPALAAVAVFAFQNNWVAFLQPLVYLQNRDLYTVSLGLSLFQEQNYTQWSLLMAASMAVSIPLLLVFFAAQRHFVRGWSFTGSKG